MLEDYVNVVLNFLEGNLYSLFCLFEFKFKKFIYLHNTRNKKRAILLLKLRGEETSCETCIHCESEFFKFFHLCDFPENKSYKCKSNDRKYWFPNQKIFFNNTEQK